MKLAAAILLAVLPRVSFAQDPAPASPDSAVSASEYNVRVDESESRLVFGLYGQLSQFVRKGKNLTGQNVEAVANYAIFEKASVQLSLAQSLDMANGLTVLYTGIRVGGSYALMGDFIRRNNSVNVNGQQTLSVSEPDAPLLAAEAGVDQYLFNGEETVIPATGVSAGVRYDRKIWRMRVSAMARYGALVISSEPVSMLTAGVGLLVRF